MQNNLDQNNLQVTFLPTFWLDKIKFLRRFEDDKSETALTNWYLTPSPMSMTRCQVKLVHMVSVYVSLIER